MTIQKQLSHLSFAAIMLVFAALPALAQTGSDNQTAVAPASNSVEATQLAALRDEFRRNRVSVPTKASTIVVAPAIGETAATTAKQPQFSLNQFMKSASKPAVVTDRQVLDFTSFEKPAFTETSPKTIQFVPSRGPKFPW
jgi:hypothetical protein